LDIVKASGGKTPAPLTETTIFADLAHEIGQAIAFIEPSSRNEQTKLKQDCLSRDGYRCVYTGAFDKNSIKAKTITMPVDGRHASTECAHIIPFALGNFDGTNSLETTNKAIIWWTLYRYFPTLRGKIDSASVNQRENAITMVQDAHTLFGSYELRFWPQENIQVCFIYISQDLQITDSYMYQNSYETNVTIPGSATTPKSGSTRIQLERHNLSIPMPNPEYFKVHHIISQILEVSGLGDEIESVLEAAEFDANLHPNGSSDVWSLLSRKMLIHVWV
jgi:HNH endonuclease